MRRGWLAAAAGAAGTAGALWLADRVRRGDSIEGEVALVTGGSRGLGYLITERLLAEGCRVAICARDRGTLERAAARLENETGRSVATYVCDVADRVAVRDTVDAVLERFGSIGVLVNCAAGIQVGPLEAMELEDFRRALDVICMGAIDTTLAVLPGMKARGHGRIVNITSIGGKVAVPHLLPYDCAKFALVGFSEGLRAEVAKDGVTVTTVVPGLMRTGSPPHVELVGRPADEYVWFALGGLLPVSAMSAERAADRVVRALRRGDAEVVLSWQAKLLRVVHAVSPGGTARLLGLVNRALPDEGAGARARGRQVDGALPRLARRAMRRAGERTNQWRSGAGAEKTGRTS